MLQIPLDQLKQCWFLAGPTASGKSGVAMKLAPRLNAEILALDSMTLYRKMDIGTAKPTSEDQAEVRHHLLDLLDPHEEFSVVHYIEEAVKVVDEVIQRGKTPLFVGGTGMFLRTLLRGLFNGPDADWAYRREMDELAEKQGNVAVHKLLQQVDAVTADRLHPNDFRRVVRALEVYKVTGTPLSEQHGQEPLPLEKRPPHIYWLSPDRDWLYNRINIRVDEMMAAGLMGEVEGLLNLDPPLGRTARQGLGYKELIDVIESRSTLEEAVEQIQIRSRQFAKRQHTWYRNLEECIEIAYDSQTRSDELAERLLQKQLAE